MAQRAEKMDARVAKYNIKRARERDTEKKESRPSVYRTLATLGASFARWNLILECPNACERGLLAYG